MVNAISSVTGTQNTTLKADTQSSAPATLASAPSISEINFVSSAIRVDNLQNVAILEVRSSETGEVIQQYPNQSQINAFKAAQQLAEQARESHQSDAPAPQSAAPQHTAVAVSSAPASTSGAGSAGGESSGGNTTTSVVA